MASPYPASLSISFRRDYKFVIQSSGAPGGRALPAEPTAWIRLTRKEQESITVVFSDTGPGIAEADLPRIWERLYRADQSRTETGLGLGLSLVKAIVQAHGGSLEVKSTEGKGSQFKIVLCAAELPVRRDLYYT